MTADRRLLLVHAHPDDETITCGATMARYVAEGAAVTLLTCTLGEEGEILVPELAGLAADRADQLGGYRVGELGAAMAHLGVTDARWLGGAGRWRDSGMLGTPPNDHPRAFWRADLDEAVAAAVAVVREVRPQVVVTYDERGGYGHPDHVQAHRVATAAVEAAADPRWQPELGPAWEVAKVYWCCVPESVVQRGIEAVTAGPTRFTAVTGPAEVPYCVPDAEVTTAVDGGRYRAQKEAALRAHATQVQVEGPFFALSNHLGQELLGTEWFRLVRGVRGPGDREDDLFAGVGG